MYSLAYTFILCLSAAASNDEALRRSVEAALAASPELLAQHRGYWAYLQAHPALADAEAEWLRIARMPEAWLLTDAFDAALRKDSAAGGAFDRYYDRLAKDTPLRRATEQLRQLEFDQHEGGQNFSQAMTYLRGNPDAAQRFLQRPERAKPIPDALSPALSFFRARPELRAALSSALGEVMDKPDARAEVLPWWQQLAREDSPASQANAALDDFFARYPQRYWQWHRRNLRLAENAGARAWIRYWETRAAHATGLGDDYAAYVQWLREHPGAAAECEARWRREFGEAPAWPPAELPPHMPATAPGHRAGMPEKPKVERPQRPTATRPAKPSIPSPTKPERPRKPEMRTR